MSAKRYIILAKAYDKKGNLLAVGENSYKKSNPVMKYFAEQAGLPAKIYLHSEVQALLRCKDKKVYKLTVERYTANGQPANAKPCPVCSLALNAWGVTEIEYTTAKGWIKEKV
jgi:deoxycytidylate deaminase